MPLTKAEKVDKKVLIEDITKKISCSFWSFRMLELKDLIGGEQILGWSAQRNY
jgi:hypothetical protein